MKSSIRNRREKGREKGQARKRKGREKGQARKRKGREKGQANNTCLNSPFLFLFKPVKTLTYSLKFAIVLITI
jgi:hypothetical protein